MSHFDFKKHLRKQILIREGWEEEVAKQEKEEVAGVKKKTWGIDSDEVDTDDPYAAPLNKMLPGDMDEKHKKRLAELILSLADASGVRLEEEINLIGLRSERDRVINSDKIVALLYEFQKEDSGYYSDENLLELAKILNQWGRLNSIKFVTQPRQATAPEEIEEPAPEKEKYRMNLANLEKTLNNIIDPKIDGKWVRYITNAVIKDIPDIPDMRLELDEARDPIAFGNTLAVLKLLNNKYKIHGLDFKPLERAVYDFLKVNNLEASEAKPELHSEPGETPEDEEEFERAETEEMPNVNAVPEKEKENKIEDEPKSKGDTKDVDFCKGLLDSIKTSDPKLFAAMEDDDTIRGAVANFANDLSFSADAVVLSALGAAAAIPPAAPFFGAMAGGAEVVARSGAAVAVAMDLMLLNGKDALIDSIGLIPWGKWIGKALGKAGKAATKAGEKAGREGAQKLLKTAGKGAKTAAESGIKNLEKTLAEKLLKAAPALGKEGAKNAAKAIMVAVEQRVQTKLKAEGQGPGAPDPNKYKDSKEYKRALKEWQKARKEAMEGEYTNCFRKDNLEIKNRALNFIEDANNYVDDFPAAFDAVIGKGIDAAMWAKEFISGQDEETEGIPKPKAPEPPPSPVAPAGMGRRAMTQPKSSKWPPPGTLRAPTRFEELKKQLDEQRYKMLLKRFNI